MTSFYTAHVSCKALNITRSRSMLHLMTIVELVQYRSKVSVTRSRHSAYHLHEKFKWRTKSNYKNSKWAYLQSRWNWGQSETHHEQCYY